MVFRSKARREFNRISAHHLIKFKSAEGHCQSVVSFARNLSAGGVLLYTQDPGVLGDVLEVSINFPGADKAIIAKGRVLRSKPLKKIGGYEVAVQFIDVDEADSRLMQKKIDEAIDLASRRKPKKANKINSNNKKTVI